MTEHFKQKDRIEHHRTEASNGEPQYPTASELEAWHAFTDHERTRYENYYTIDEFARDPEHPTDAEIEAVRHLNDRFTTSQLTTFEQYFGYPDPREQSQQAPREDDPPRTYR